VAYWAAKARYRGRLAGWLAGGTEPAADRNAWLAVGTGGGPVPGAEAGLGAGWVGGLGGGRRAGRRSQARPLLGREWPDAAR